MSEWTDGYRAALADVGRLTHSRGIVTTSQFHEPGSSRSHTGRRALMFAKLLPDLDGDALVIEREQDNRIRRRRLAAVREALPLFEAEP